MQKRVHLTKKFLSLFALFIFFSVIIVAGTNPNGDGPQKVESHIKRIKAAGQLVVGTSADYPPYEFHLLNDQTEEIVGIDIEVAKAVAEELGVKLVVKNFVFSQLFKALNSKKVDLVIAGLTPTEARKKIVDFSDVYYKAIQNMLIRLDDIGNIKSLEDLRGKIVGTQTESIQEDLVRNRIVGATFVAKDNVNDLVMDLEKKNIDAVILEEPVAASYVRSSTKFHNIDCSADGDMPVGSAIAVRKGSGEFLKVINQILAKLKKTDKITEYVENAKLLMNKR